MTLRPPQDIHNCESASCQKRYPTPSTLRNDPVVSTVNRKLSGRRQNAFGGHRSNSGHNNSVDNTRGNGDHYGCRRHSKRSCVQHCVRRPAVSQRKGKSVTLSLHPKVPQDSHSSRMQKSYVKVVLSVERMREGDRDRGREKGARGQVTVGHDETCSCSWTCSKTRYRRHSPSRSCCLTLSQQQDPSQECFRCCR